MGSGGALLIEVEATARPRRNDTRGLEGFLDNYPEAPLGVLACNCPEAHALTRISHKISGLDYKRAQKILNPNTLHDRLDFSVSAAY